MSVFIIISVLLALIVAKSGGAIRPVVTFTPNWGNILQGDSVTLTCDVISTKPEEPRSYQWYKDNQPIQKYKQKMNIRSSEVEQSGDYQCRVSGRDISDPVTLNVINSDLILQRPPSDIYEGDPLTLRCHHATCYTADPPTFYKDKKEILSEFSDELHIDKVDLNTAGHYKCTKKIACEAKKYKDEFYLSVKELFSVPEVKTPYGIIAGDNMALICDTKLDPRKANTELQFAFKRDGRTVQEFSVSDTYRVWSAQTTDSGYYTCEVRTATDTVRKRSDGLYIQIQELFPPPKINMNLRVTEGDEMTVSCDTRLHPDRRGTKLQFAFYRDGRAVQYFSVSDKYRMQSAQMEDSGYYTCEVRTATDTVRKMSDELYIQIQKLFPPPKINVNLRIIEGDEMTVSCDTGLNLDRHGTDLQFAFYRDGRTVQKFSVSDKYRVWSAQLKDSGNYTCELRTATDTVRKSAGFYIQIHELFTTPKIKVTPNRFIEGGDITVVCDTKVDPNRTSTELQFAFYRDGRTIQEFSVSNTYRVQSARMEDSGNYTCEVKMMSKNLQKMSNEFYLKITQGYLKQNIIRMVLSVCILAAAVCFIYFHNKW